MLALNKILRRVFYKYSSLALKIDNTLKVGHLTLTNKEKRNALSLNTVRQMYKALMEVKQRAVSENIKILILRGEGTVFSAGHDLKELMGSKQPVNILKQCSKTLVLLRQLPVVTLCVLNNHAIAAGFQLALTCDMIIASQNVTFGIPGVKRGIFPSTPLVQLERSLKSTCFTKEIVMLGQSMTAKQAFDLGIINKIVPIDKLDDEVDSYIAKASRLSREVLSLGKRVIANQQLHSLEVAYQIATAGMVQNIADLYDCQQGLAAFADKRKPCFKK